MDTAIMLGNTISINCEAEGYPIPAITWFKGQGKFANLLAMQLRPSACRLSSFKLDGLNVQTQRQSQTLAY